MTTPHCAHRIATLLCSAALLSASALAQAAPVSAWELNSIDSNFNDSWSFGDLFTVGSSNITLTSLGALDIGKDGFQTAGGIAVGLFRESDQVLLASTQVLSTDTLVGNYRFSDIGDIVLGANTRYRIVADNGVDLYNIAFNTPSVVDPRITWNSFGYCRTGRLTFCNNETGTTTTWMGNFQLEGPRDGGSVPEPSVLALLGAGLLALVLGKRRRRAD